MRVLPLVLKKLGSEKSSPNGMGYHSGRKCNFRSMLILESKRGVCYRSEWKKVVLEDLKTTYGATVVVVECMKIVA